jgi:hypothetical protein
MRLSTLVVLAYDKTRRAFSATVRFNPLLAACHRCRVQSSACTCTYVLEFVSLERPCLSIIQNTRPHSEVALHGLVTHVGNAMRGVPLRVSLGAAHGVGGMAYLRGVSPVPPGGYQSHEAIPVTEQAYRLEDPAWTVYRPHYRVCDALLLLARMGAGDLGLLTGPPGKPLRDILQNVIDREQTIPCSMTPGIARAVENYASDRETMLMNTAYTAVMVLSKAQEAYAQPGTGSVAKPTAVGTEKDPIIDQLSSSRAQYGFSCDVATVPHAHSPATGTNLAVIAKLAETMIHDMYPCIVNDSGLSIDIHLPSQAYTDHIDALLKQVITMSVGISARLTYVVKRV